jgi:hypothetical protein
MKKIKFNLGDVSKMYTSLIFLEKNIFKLTENSFETCNSIHFNNDVLKIFIYF